MRYILVTETEGRFKWTSSDEEECLDRYTYIINPFITEFTHSLTLSTVTTRF